jgi:hypothetical protein
MIYKNSFDRTTKVISSFTSVLLLSIIIKFCLDEDGILLPVIISILFAFILLLSYAWSPKQFETDASNITIRKMWNPIVIPRESIIESRLIDANEISGSVRLMGSGGLFGYYGKFNNSKLKTYNLQAGNRMNLVLIKTTDKTYVLTPDNREDFLKDLQGLV